MELTFTLEKHYDDASYRTNWKSAVASVHSQTKLRVTLLRIVFPDNEAIEVRPKKTRGIPLRDVFSHVDLLD